MGRGGLGFMSVYVGIYVAIIEIALILLSNGIGKQ